LSLLNRAHQHVAQLCHNFWIIGGYSKFFDIIFFVIYFKHLNEITVSPSQTDKSKNVEHLVSIVNIFLNSALQVGCFRSFIQLNQQVSSAWCIGNET
jgi:hypothetical protein